jgi:transcriptional regulator GlxA family with amidase domain
MPLVNKASLNKKPFTVCFYLQDGVEVLDFAGPMEVFSYAGAKIFTVSKTKNPIRSQRALKVIPDYDITDAPAYDILAVFGGNAGNAFNDPEVIAWIQSRQKTTQYYFSVCTGAFILGKAGLLDNLTITTFHESIAALQKAVPTSKVLPNTRFVDNGNIITTAGISAGIDGALHVVERLNGRDFAQKLAAYIEYDKWVPGQGLIIRK